MKEPAKINVIDRWATFGIFCALLLLYGRTLCPTVGVGDSGELITAAVTLGIPHPTGYPLYILLGRLFLFIFPFGEAAFRMNFFSAVTAALGGAVFYRWMRALGNSYKTAFSTALTLGCSLSFWSQATIARVYSLNALLVCLCLYYGFSPVQTSRTRSLFFFWWGLALANHTISIIVGALFLLLKLFHRDFSLKEIRSALFILPGLSFYLYIPFRSRMNPPLDIGNPETPAALWAYLTRSGYWRNSYVESLSDIPAVVWHYVTTLPEEFTWLGVALIIMGTYHLISKKKYDLLLIAWGLFFLNIVPVALHGSVRDIFQWPRYMISGYMGVGLVIGYGISFFSQQIFTPLDTADSGSCANVSGDKTPHRLPSLNKLLQSGLPVLTPLLLLWNHFPQNNRSGDYMAYDYNYKALSALPRNAAVFPTGDNTAYPMMYLQKVLGVREDVKLHISYYQQDKWIIFDRSRELFFTDIFFKIPPDTVLRADGLFFRLMKPREPPPAIRNWESLKIRGANHANLVRRDFLNRSLASQYWYFMALAVMPLQGQDTGKLLRHSLDVGYDDDRAWTRVGFFYYLQGDLQRAEKFLLGSLNVNAKNKDVALMLEKIRAERRGGRP